MFRSACCRLMGLVVGKQLERLLWVGCLLICWIRKSGSNFRLLPTLIRFASSSCAICLLVSQDQLGSWLTLLLYLTFPKKLLLPLPSSALPVLSSQTCLCCRVSSLLSRWLSSAC